MTKTEEAIPTLSALFEVAVEKLRENEHKGHWRFEAPMDLWNRLSQETAELHAEVQKAQRGQPFDPRAIARECGDIVNLAMMVADVTGGLQ